jgi:hypothetical protein
MPGTDPVAAPQLAQSKKGDVSGDFFDFFFSLLLLLLLLLLLVLPPPPALCFLRGGMMLQERSVGGWVGLREGSSSTSSAAWVVH